MEKRLPLALFLAFLVLFGWTLLQAWLFPKPPAPPPSAEAPSASAPATPGVAGGQESTTPAASVAAAEPPALGEDTERALELTIDGPGDSGTAPTPGAYRARFSNRGAALEELLLCGFVRRAGLKKEEERRDPTNWLPLLEPIVGAGGARTGSLLVKRQPSSEALVPRDLDQVLWQMEELPLPARGVRFRYSPPGGAVVFEKVVAFEPGTWHLRFTFSIENVSAGPGGARDFLLVPAGCVPPELRDRFYAEPTAVAIGGKPNDLEIATKAAPSMKEAGALDVPKPMLVAGVDNKYFAFLLREVSAGNTLGGATYTPVHEGGPDPRALLELSVPLKLALPEPGKKQSWEYVVFAGPKDRHAFAEDYAPHQLVLDADLQVDAIAKGLLVVLGFLHRLVGNWGVAIILLTLGVRLALFPLTRRSQTTMARYQKKMKRVQPRLEEVKKRFENEPQKLREAQARIMQEEGAFPPLGGCLPIFLQMPVFFGLFSALRTSFDLRQAPFFGYIQDLSRPDHLLQLGLELPLLPDIEYLNLLPLVMVVLWVLQQALMPKPADEQAARMQKMMLFMPVVFGVMLYNYAAGLSLYMMTTSTLSIVEQRLIRKLWPIDDTEVQAKEKKGCNLFAGAMQGMADRHREQLQRVQAMQAEQRRQRDKRRR